MNDGPKGFADLAHLSEDARIRTIAEHVKRTKQIAAVFVDNKTKAARYAKKLEATKICKVLEQVDPPIFGQAPGVALLKVGPLPE